MTPDANARWMALALSLGRRGMGRVWPNPAVGCVIVRENRVLGRGWTADGGRPHAETVALAQAGDARGATAYVTLEPCAHHGRTPPCAEALIAAGVARVVVATGDPDARVAGRGLAMLRAAGIAVIVGVREVEARADHAGFLSRIVQGRPFLTLKLAASLDGRIATASGESRWISGPAARAMVHLMRATHDAVMVGGGTARADDPMLDVRGMGARPQPVRIVLSADLDLPFDSRLAQTANEVPLWLIRGAAVETAQVANWERLGARTLVCATDPDGRLDSRSALTVLAGQGITRVLCEGGGQVAAALLKADLVDDLVVVQAGLAMGSEGAPMLGRLQVERLAEAPRLRLAEVRSVGPDVVSRWNRAEVAASL